jgi:hypothetical protein
LLEECLSAVEEHLAGEDDQPDRGRRHKA